MKEMPPPDPSGIPDHTLAFGLHILPRLPCTPALQWLAEQQMALNRGLAGIAKRSWNPRRGAALTWCPKLCKALFTNDCSILTLTL